VIYYGLLFAGEVQLGEVMAVFDIVGGDDFAIHRAARS
jgi:hypothetical protein